MPSINEVIERVSRLRPDAYDDDTKGGWLVELDGTLFNEVILTHEGERPTIPRRYPEDGGLPLLVGAPYDRLYDLYIMAQVDFYNKDLEDYNNSVTLFNTALDSYKKWYHRTHSPLARVDRFKT